MNQQLGRRLSVALFGAAVGMTALMSSTAFADVTRLVVSSTMPLGPFDGREYRYIQGTLLGTAPGGAYAVPIEMMFPTAAEDFNGFAVVDAVGMGQIGLTEAQWPPEGGRPHPTWPYFGDTFLFENGNLVVSVMWDKARLETLGIGMIGAAGDAYEILRDAAELARNPDFLHLRAERTPPAADHVIVTGYSNSAVFARAWFSFGLNQAEGSPVFDGALLLAARQTTCVNVATNENAPCDPARTDGAKIISVLTETDLETRGPGLRAEVPDYRQIELAGTAHIPTVLVNWLQFGAPEQNPVDTTPVFRAALANLEAWIADGTEPPANAYIDVPTAPTRLIGTADFWDVARDADGNVLGGVRLPHMANGSGVGAPLGEYHGYNEVTQLGGGFPITGTFTPFSADEIRRRYPTRDAYVAAVRAAADRLVEDRYILQADAEAYIAAAEAAPYWN
ncbi:MAG: alpha/beta hydrolase domain-containing protein [Bauldia sp.]